jgi:tetratricopeptide (TPR) repeat protein
VELGLLTAYAQKRLADALPLLAKAGGLYPGNGGIQGFLAMLQVDLGDDTQALAVIDSAVKRWPADPRVNSVAASVNRIRGDQEAAGRFARVVLGISQRDRDALSILGDADLERGNYDSARDRYAKAFPELLAAGQPKLDRANYQAAVDLVPVLQKAGDSSQANSLLDRSQDVMRRLPRLGWRGTGITDARIHALRGDKAGALAALREAGKAGWCGPYWRYYRDFDPALASIRNEPGFKAVFADIDRKLAGQRAELAARPAS